MIGTGTVGSRPTSSLYRRECQLSAGRDERYMRMRQDLARDFLRAAAQGRRDRVVILLQLGAHCGVMTEENKTPLHLAAERGHTDTVIALMKRGALLNTRDARGCTPLFLALKHGHLHTVAAIREEIRMRRVLRAEFNAILP